MSKRMRTAIAVALLLALSACGGTTAPSEPAEPLESEDVATVEPTATALTATATPPEATPPEATAAVDNGNGRPATITLDISGTPSSDGGYSASGPARFCGNAVMNLTGNIRSFSFEFPDSGEHQINDVSFSSDDLLPGSSTSAFHIGVGVKAVEGGEPPSTVVDTELPGSDDSGSAQLSDAGGTTTLVVTAADELGQTISMTATCGPR